MINLVGCGVKVTGIGVEVGITVKVGVVVGVEIETGTHATRASKSRTITNEILFFIYGLERSTQRDCRKTEISESPYGRLFSPVGN
jgi:hypothetical protein